MHHKLLDTVVRHPIELAIRRELDRISIGSKVRFCAYQGFAELTPAKEDDSYSHEAVIRARHKDPDESWPPHRDYDCTFDLGSLSYNEVHVFVAGRSTEVLALSIDAAALDVWTHSNMFGRYENPVRVIFHAMKRS